MNVECPDCRSVFRVDPAKVPVTGVRARCSVCGGILVLPPGRAPAGDVGGGTGVGRSATTPTGVTGRITPAMASARIAAPGTPGGTPAVAAPRVSGGAAAVATPRTSGSIASAAAPPASRPTPARGTPAFPSSAAATPARPLSPARSGTPAAGVGAAATAAPAAAPRRINPFLNADPAQRARRLARALVSDLIAYHPGRREEGLREGTLRQLFRDEIKKSYEEYVEQVGRDVAESTPHFRDALNELLADGQPLF